jgi:hypothetical protein
LILAVCLWGWKILFPNEAIRPVGEGFGVGQSAGKSRMVEIPIPLGRCPSTAALTKVGDKNASEIVRLTCRTLRFSREAICWVDVTLPEMSSSTQRRS